MQYAKQLKAIADGKRYQIIQLLLQKTYCVRALAKKLSVSPPAISQHLAILKDAGLVDCGKRGYHVHYTVNTEALKELSVFFSQLAQVVPDDCKRTTCEEFDEKYCRTNTLE